MIVTYKGRKHRTDAVGEYDPESGKLIVKKGSIVSESIASFPGALSVKKMRQDNLDADGRLKEDLLFSTPSAAAAFVTGYSANGLLSWHVEKHKTLRDFLKNKQGE